MEAVETGNVDLVRDLLKEGKNPNERDKQGLLPVHIAASRGYQDVVKELVSAGADINARDKFQRTALHLAAVPGQKAVAVYLLLRGADTEARGENGLRPFELASAVGHEELAWIIALAGRADLDYVRRLARSVATRPSRPTLSADRRIVTTLLEEKGHDAVFEPLVTALLQEVRNEKPQPKRPATSTSNSHTESDSRQATKPTSSTHRPSRFTGVPAESVTVGRSWGVTSSDESVIVGEVETLEEGGDFQKIINEAVVELDRIQLEESISALDAFNEYFRSIGKGELSDLNRTLRAALMLYTDDRFFRVLNTCWRSGRSRDLLWFSTLMSMAFRNAKYFIAGDVYRGVNLADVHHYEPGLVFRWPFFVSASTDRGVAAEFGMTLVDIEVPSFANVRDISYCSVYPEEGEVLFRAYEVFEVLGASEQGIHIRVFDDEWFGTGYEISERRRLDMIK
jgi:hypothetical protein